MESTIDTIDVAHRVGKKKKDRPRAIIVRFHNRDDRMEVLRERKKLKNTGITIVDDLCWELLQVFNRVRNDERVNEPQLDPAKVQDIISRFFISY